MNTGLHCWNWVCKKEADTMLYRTLKRMIERGNTEGIEKKLDIFYAANKLTEMEYTELLEMYQSREGA